MKPKKTPSNPPAAKLVFDGLIKARTTKQAESDFALIASREGKKVPELARQVFNSAIRTDKDQHPDFWAKLSTKTP